jgi:hypothetical protein
VCHVCIIWQPTKGHFFTWGQCSLRQTRGDCLGSGCDCLVLQWSLSSRKALIPQLSYSGSLRLTFSLLLRKVFPWEPGEKAPSPLQLLRHATREIRASQGLILTADGMGV